MLLRSLRVLTVLMMTAAGAAACSSSSSGDGHDGHGSTSGGSTGSNQVNCVNDPRVTTFASGMQAKSASGKFVAEIVNASPSPPQRGPGDAGINAWTMKFTLDGAAPPASAITVTTNMPDHGHGSPRIPEITENGDGTFSVNGLYLFMGGVWQITFAAADGAETAMLSICVQ